MAICRKCIHYNICSYSTVLEKEIKCKDFICKANVANINPSDDNFGAVLNCAIRYSLGRQTYMPHLVMDFTRPLLPQLSDKTLWCMARDIREAGTYGSPVIDEPEWMKFLEEVDTEVERREAEIDRGVDNAKQI